MRDSTRFCPRTIAFYVFGTTLALFCMPIVFPEGVLTHETIHKLFFQAFATSLLVATFFTFTDHLSAPYHEIWSNMTDAVIGSVIPLGIMLGLPKTYEMIVQDVPLEESQLLYSVHVLSLLALWIAVHFCLIAVSGRIVGNMLHDR